mmetsp:Transcript_10899/g.40649  ORF Transcript_10899/g.40649 Transcript_10899/m.40649 type:complete len:109 (+) Transcript_10899:28-354(+)
MVSFNTCWLRSPSVYPIAQTRRMFHENRRSVSLWRVMWRVIPHITFLHSISLTKFSSTFNEKHHVDTTHEIHSRHKKFFPPLPFYYRIFSRNFISKCFRIRFINVGHC